MLSLPRILVASIVSASVFSSAAPVAVAQNIALEAAVTTESRPEVEVLARGPVHEAFAEPVSMQMTQPLVVDRAPPDPIEEQPPEQVPEGNYLQWIPGYWGWEDDRGDFVWISGVWRDCPPEQTWVPGYWSEADRGWSWTAGFWTSNKVQEVEYLPDPPETVEAGPNVDPPSDNHIWVPGVWRYVETRYVWRPGYWSVAQPDWLWVPAHYVRSPNGYIFVDGYWDYPLVHRGLLFAPVYYHQPLYTRANYVYTPSAVISTDLLTVHLFSRARYCHYYFGDYYGAQYREIGIEPWLMSPRTRGSYDPIFAYYNWNYRREGRDWSRIASARYDFFDRNRDYRPAHTYDQLRRQQFEPTHGGDTNIQNIVAQQNNLVLNFNQFVENSQRDDRGDRDRDDGFRFARLGTDERRAVAREATAIRSFQKRRTQIENGGHGNRELDQNTAIGATARGQQSLSLADLNNAESSGRRRDGRRSLTDLPPRPDQTAGPGAGGLTNNTENAPELNAPNGKAERGNASDPGIGRTGGPDDGKNAASQTRAPNAPPAVDGLGDTEATRRPGRSTRNGRDDADRGNTSDPQRRSAGTGDRTPDPNGGENAANQSRAPNGVPAVDGLRNAEAADRSDQSSRTGRSNADRGNTSDPQRRSAGTSDRNPDPNVRENAATQTRLPNAAPATNGLGNTETTRDRAGQSTQNGRSNTVGRKSTGPQNGGEPRLNPPSKLDPKASDRGRDLSDLQTRGDDRNRDRNKGGLTQDAARRASNYAPGARTPDQRPTADINVPLDTKAPSTSNTNSGNRNIGGRDGDRRNTVEQQRSANPFRGGTGDSRDKGKSESVRLDANQIPSAVRPDQSRPPSGDIRSRRPSGKNSPSQVNSDSSNRTPPRQSIENPSPRRQGSRRDGAVQPAQRLTRDPDGLRSTSAGAERPGSRPGRGPESTQKSDKKVNDDANKRRKKDTDKDDR